MSRFAWLALLAPTLVGQEKSAYQIAQEAAWRKYPTLAIGTAAPDFNLPGTDGKKHSLAEFKKSPVLAVLFTCNHCPTAQMYEDRIKALVSAYKSKGVAFVAIQPNASQVLAPGGGDDKIEALTIRLAQ